jgi:cytochrome b
MIADPADDLQDGMYDDPQHLKLWDWPVRIVHWSFALLLPALWWTWKYDQMPTHRLLGHVMLGLLVFRLYWGLVGSSPARFGSFLKGPRTVAAYLKALAAKSAEPVVGHNALGGWSVVALLGFLTAQVLIGLFTQDVDGLESGPLAQFVSYEIADGARYWHGLLFNVLLGLVAVHLAAILLYLVVKRDNLVGPMLTGRKRMTAPAIPPSFVPVRRVSLGMALAAGTAWWVSLGCPLPGATA